MTLQPLPSMSAISSNRNYGFPQGSYYEVSIPFTPANKELLGHYRLWIPAHVPVLRGLIVKQHGCGDPAAATGLDHANDLQWQALTSKHQFALLGTKLPTDYPLCTDEAIKNGATESAFSAALDALAKESHHPELTRVPWALWGHSGGADWVMQMLHHHPERVIAVVNMRCGGILSTLGKSEILDLDPKSVPTVLDVPVLWAIGDRDPYVDECINLPKQIFSKFRKAGANWAIAVEVNTAHESGDTRFLAIPYLDAILTTRLSDDSFNLGSIQESQGWLGDTVTHNITSVVQYQGNPLEAAWLPNQETAQKWQQYVTLNAWNQLGNGLCRVEKSSILKVVQHSTEDCYPNKILPTQKPAAPTNIQATKTKKAEMVVTWNYYPDLENGLPSFRIYRDKSLIRVFQGQGHNFGDAPDPPHIVLEFCDKDAKSGAVYNVSAFNARGESVSKPARIS